MEEDNQIKRNRRIISNFGNVVQWPWHFLYVSH